MHASLPSQGATPAGDRLSWEDLPFTGRERESGELCALLRDPTVRLVSVLGPGGVGKTRLALEIAGRVRADFADGLVFVPLAGLRAAGEIMPAVAGALGLQLPLGGDVQLALYEHLGPRRTLLILDNFEHLLTGLPDESTAAAGGEGAPGAALLVHEILAAAPRVKVLVTSREKLNLLGEVLYPLPGLELPPVDATEAGDSFPAMQLFVQRARQARPDFALDDRNLPAVAEICRLVDGMPLGLLLSAAWVELYSPEDIAEQIRGGLDFLSHDLRNVPPRHQSLRAVCDSSYDRLKDELQSLFAKLSVFRGGFTLPAATAVAGADARALRALVDKSLLLRDPDAGRYRMHELLRQYAGEKLAATGDVDCTRAAHGGYFLEFLRAHERALKSTAQITALEEIEADLENIRLAWERAVEQRDCAALGRAAPALYAFCDMRCRYREGEALFAAARDALPARGGDALHPAAALLWLSWYDLQAYAAQPVAREAVAAYARDLLADAQARGDAEAAASSLVLLGAVAEDQGDFATAIDCCEQAMATHAALDDFYWVNMRVGLCYQALRQYGRAVRSFRQSLERGEALGERVKQGWSLVNIGDSLGMQGQWPAAEPYLRRARALFLETGTRLGVLWAQCSLAKALLARGERAQSRQLAEDAARIAASVHSAAWVEKTRDLLSAVADREKASQHAATQPLIEPLSEREREVLRLLKSDLDGPEIARTLVVSLNTVRFHTKNIYRKLEVSNRREAVRRAEELGV